MCIKKGELSFVDFGVGSDFKINDTDPAIADPLIAL